MSDTVTRIEIEPTPGPAPTRRGPWSRVATVLSSVALGAVVVVALAMIVVPALLRATPYRVVPLGDPSEVESAIQWWTDLTAAGGEGMVVKPYDFIPTGQKQLVQPALKCRGREYLRIIYGPDYLLPGNLERLRERNVKSKRNLALREFALGVEGLERFVAGQPLRAVHQCVFGVLALESEAIDPRL